MPTISILEGLITLVYRFVCNDKCKVSILSTLYENNSVAHNMKAQLRAVEYLWECIYVYKIYIYTYRRFVNIGKFKEYFISFLPHN